MNINDYIVQYYKFNESSTDGTSGELVDSSYGGNSGGQANDNYNLISTNGKFGNAIEGVNGGAKVDISLIFNDRLSISMWIKPTAYDLGSSLHTLIEKPSDFYLEFYNGDLKFRNYNNSPTEIIDASNFTADTWTHIVVTISNIEGTKIYINGTKTNSNSKAVSIRNNNNYLNLFRWHANDNDEIYKGLIDELVIYYEALNKPAILKLYNSGNGVELNPTSGVSKNYVDSPFFKLLINSLYIHTTDIYIEKDCIEDDYIADKFSVAIDNDVISLSININEIMFPNVVIKSIPLNMKLYVKDFFTIINGNTLQVFKIDNIILDYPLYITNEFQIDIYNGIEDVTNKGNLNYAYKKQDYKPLILSSNWISNSILLKIQSLDILTSHILYTTSGKIIKVFFDTSKDYINASVLYQGSLWYNIELFFITKDF